LLKFLKSFRLNFVNLFFLLDLALAFGIRVMAGASENGTCDLELDVHLASSGPVG